MLPTLTVASQLKSSPSTKRQYLVYGFLREINDHKVDIADDIAFVCLQFYYASDCFETTGRYIRITDSVNRSIRSRMQIANTALGAVVIDADHAKKYEWVFKVGHIGNFLQAIVIGIVCVGSGDNEPGESATDPIVLDNGLFEHRKFQDQIYPDFYGLSNTGCSHSVEGEGNGPYPEYSQGGKSIVMTLSVTRCNLGILSFATTIPRDVFKFDMSGKKYKMAVSLYNASIRLKQYTEFTDFAVDCPPDCFHCSQISRWLLF